MDRLNINAEETTDLLPKNREQVESIVPVYLQVQDLSLYIKEQTSSVFTKKSQEKQVLFGINAAFYPGEMVAIMGASGSGKTSLLNVMSGRTPGNGHITGSLLLNGRPFTSKYSRILGYVKQKDLLMGTCTVRETLTYSAFLRLGTDINTSTKLSRVERLINDLGLQDCSDRRIGTDLSRGISGGELKRTAIGNELITRPSVLLCDEPTSGLDSATAYSLLRTLKHLADAGHTVICTIHQPRSNIFYMFDKLLLLGSGYQIYYGRVDYSIEYFSNNGYKCPKHSNPADFFLDVVTGALPDSDPEVILSLNKAYLNSPQLIEHVKLPDHVETVPIDDHSTLKTNVTPWYVQIRYLVVRQWNNIIRNSGNALAQLFQHLIFSLLVGLMYLRIGTDSESIPDRIAAIFFVMLNATFIPAYTLVFLFPEERPIVNRERASGMYGTFAYYLTSSLVDFPFQFGFVILDSAMCYWMIGLQPNLSNYLTFIVLILLTLFAIQSSSLCVSAISPNVVTANIIEGIVFTLFLMFSGFFLNVKRIPVYFKPFEYISPYKYCFHALLNNDLPGLNFTCRPTPCPAFCQRVNCTLPCMLPNGMAVLHSYNMDNGSILIDISILVGFIVFYKLLGYCLIRWVKIGMD